MYVLTHNHTFHLPCNCSASLSVYLSITNQTNDNLQLIKLSFRYNFILFYLAPSFLSLTITLYSVKVNCKDLDTSTLFKTLKV